MVGHEYLSHLSLSTSRAAFQEATPSAPNAHVNRGYALAPEIILCFQKPLQVPREIAPAMVALNSALPRAGDAFVRKLCVE